MKKLILAAVLLSSVAAYAQPLPAEVTLKVTQAEIELISNGLQTQPFGQVLPLMNKLRQQILEQTPKPVENNQDPPKPSDK